MWLLVLQVRGLEWHRTAQPDLGVWEHFRLAEVQEGRLSCTVNPTNKFWVNFTHYNHTVNLRELLELQTRGLWELNLSCAELCEGSVESTERVRDSSALLEAERWQTNSFTIYARLACLLKCTVISLNDGKKNSMIFEAALKPYSRIALF